MVRLNDFLLFLRNKGWQIIESDIKTLTAYTGTKVNTTMEIAFVDNEDHTIKRKDENAKISAIKIKSVKVEKRASIPRKEDMLKDLMALTKHRVDVIYAVADEDESFSDYLKSIGFETIMKDINAEKHLKYYCQSKTFSSFKSENKSRMLLGKFKGSFSQAGSDSGDEMDKKYESIISQAIYSDRDLEFICMYLNVIKEYFEVENEDYGGIYESELEDINELLQIFGAYLEQV